MIIKQYDIIIIGGGPAGLSAGIYASRARLRTLLIEKGMFGGLIANAELVENYPGFPEGISGFDIGERMSQQASRFGLETLSAEVTGVDLLKDIKVINTTEGDFSARAIIIASGAERKRLGVPGEDIFVNRGVSYCATCDGALFRDRVVAVVGGGDSAFGRGHVPYQVRIEGDNRPSPQSAPRFQDGARKSLIQ